MVKVNFWPSRTIVDILDNEVCFGNRATPELLNLQIECVGKNLGIKALEGNQAGKDDLDSSEVTHSAHF